jgi:hypothetical protein
MPEIRPKPLYRAARKRLAWLLGLHALPDECVNGIAWLLAAHKASRERVKGHTPARWAATLRKVESRIRRGDNNPETTRVITDPLFGADVETWTRLAPIVADPDVSPDDKLAAIETRRRELEALPEIDALYALRVMLVTQALLFIWYFFAAGRDDHVRQWHFVLAILEAAGESTDGLRKNPERLRRDVEQFLVSSREPLPMIVPKPLAILMGGRA